MWKIIRNHIKILIKINKKNVKESSIDFSFEIVQSISLWDDSGADRGLSMRASAVGWNLSYM